MKPQAAQVHRQSLDQSSQLLPAGVLAIGVDEVDDILIGWCAPSVGRVASISLSWTGAGSTDFARWLGEEQGFSAEQALDAANRLLGRIHRRAHG